METTSHATSQPYAQSCAHTLDKATHMSITGSSLTHRLCVTYISALPPDRTQAIKSSSEAIWQRSTSSCTRIVCPQPWGPDALSSDWKPPLPRRSTGTGQQGHVSMQELVFTYKYHQAIYKKEFSLYLGNTSIISDLKTRLEMSPCGTDSRCW